MRIRGLQNALHFGATKRTGTTKEAGRKWKPGREQYSVIIASETDARKKTYGFYITRRAVVAAAAAAALVVVVFAGLTVLSLLRTSYYSAKANELKGRILTQSSQLDTYAGEIDALSSELDGWRQDFQASQTGE